MRLSPRFDGEPLLRIDAPLGDVAVPLVRQRARLASALAGLDEAGWATPSRCAGWSVQDVVNHLCTTNQFFTFSINAGLAGEPTSILTNFDPVATPAQLVAAERATSVAETLERFVSSNAALASAVTDLDDETWSMPAEAPPGHIAIREVALHALWDAWVHERDVLLPLGVDPVRQPDEIIGSLVYVAALSPAFAASMDAERSGLLFVHVTDPDAAFVVEAGRTTVVRDGPPPDGAVTVSGDAVELLEALSVRASLPQSVPDDAHWLVEGLATVFDHA